MLNLYSFFHINTSFSSVEKKKLPSLLKNCYWPLLNLIEKNNFNIAVEASGRSLEEIKKIDNEWIKKLKYLIKKKKCEFIASGYCQIIAPAVPYEVNIYNLKIGNKVYKKLLDIQPRLALINEQVFSNSLIKIYKKYFDAIILDWIDAKKNIKNLDKFSQISNYLIDDKKNKIKVIWSNSVAFQKFQRLVYGEIDMKNYIDFLNFVKKEKNICIYSSDCEIFNYRPKRYYEEKKIIENEWKKIQNIFEFLNNQKSKFKFQTFKKILASNNNKQIEITSAEKPVSTKKQTKYNITRWLICGKNNYYINKLCWRIYYILKNYKIKNENSWKFLCISWASDLRTHCSELKLKSQLKQIYFFLKKKKNKIKFKKKKILFIKNLNKNEKNILISQNFIKFENKNTCCILNKKKGLAIDSFINKNISSKSLFGTIYQGSINYLDNQSDFFSGHSNLFDKNFTKITDLNILSDRPKILDLGRNIYQIELNHTFYTKEIIKKIIILDLNKSQLVINLNLKKINLKILRMLNFTFNPFAFNNKKLFFSSHFGSQDIEKFKINKSFNYGSYVQDVTRLTSTNNCLPITSGILNIGDNKKIVQFSYDNSVSPVAGLLEFKKYKESFFLRTSFSAREQDDTSQHLFDSEINFKLNISTKRIKN